jgi:PAS domain-containing protein
MQVSHATKPNQKERRTLVVGNWVWNLETREYSWSHEMYNIFNLKPGQSPIRTGIFLNCVHPNDRQMVVRALGKALVGEQSYNIDHRIVWPDGSVRFIHGEAAVIFDKVGRPIRMLGTVQDITIMRKEE